MYRYVYPYFSSFSQRRHRLLFCSTPALGFVNSVGSKLTQSALTDALIAGIANGQTSYKLVGRYISSPLRWYVPNSLQTIVRCVDSITDQAQGNHHGQRKQIQHRRRSKRYHVRNIPLGQVRLHHLLGLNCKSVNERVVDHK